MFAADNDDSSDGKFFGGKTERGAPTQVKVWRPETFSREIEGDFPFFRRSTVARLHFPFSS